MLPGWKLDLITIVGQADEMLSCRFFCHFGRGYLVPVGFVVELLHCGRLRTHCNHNVFDKFIKDEGRAISVRRCNTFGGCDHVKSFASKREGMEFMWLSKPSSKISSVILFCDDTSLKVLVEAIFGMAAASSSLPRVIQSGLWILKKRYCVA